MNKMIEVNLENGKSCIIGSRFVHGFVPEKEGWLILVGYNTRIMITQEEYDRIISHFDVTWTPKKKVTDETTFGIPMTDTVKGGEYEI